MKEITEIRRENLAKLRTKYRTLDEFAEACGISSSQLSQWINGSLDSKTGRPRGMRSESCRRIEEKIGMSKNWLDTDHTSELSKLIDSLETKIDLSSNISKATLSADQVPLISWVTAGSLVDIEDNHLPGEADQWVTPEYTKPSRHAFALRVEGDSMSGGTNGVNFPDGCLIIIDPERAPKSGDYVVAKDTTTQKATFKKLTTDGASWFLKPINPAYPTKEIDDPALRVIGVVVEWQTGGKL
jgi:SOS-response transcriptional repressor LexA